MKKYLEDSNGNKAYIDYFGSEEKAQHTLDSLVDCKNCVNCSRCSDCSDAKNKKDESMPIPKIENIDQVVYDACSQPNALNMENWHTCETTHCRAGWVVHLAGEAGRKLEERHNTLLAAMLIYRESGSPINPARFYDDNETALADMKARAKATATEL